MTNAAHPAGHHRPGHRVPDLSVRRIGSAARRSTVDDAEPGEQLVLGLVSGDGWAPGSVPGKARAAPAQRGGREATSGHRATPHGPGATEEGRPAEHGTQGVVHRESRSGGQPPEEPPMLLTVPQVEAALQLGRTRTYELLRSGEIPVLRVGRLIRVSRLALEQWVAQRSVPGPS
jgi:excisionase family DNA binding protein